MHRAHNARQSDFAVHAPKSTTMKRPIDLAACPIAWVPSVGRDKSTLSVFMRLTETIWNLIALMQYLLCRPLNWRLEKGKSHLCWFGRCECGCPNNCHFYNLFLFVSQAGLLDLTNNVYHQRGVFDSNTPKSWKAIGTTRQSHRQTKVQKAKTDKHTALNGY